MNTVVVMSKLPFALKFENAKKEVKIIKGMNTANIVKTGQKGLYATTIMDEEDWKFFVLINKDEKYLKNNLIFAEAKSNNAQAKAKDNKQSLTGMEQVNPKKLKNISASTSDEANSGVKEVVA